jgi:hypothetical protein
MVTYFNDIAKTIGDAYSDTFSPVSIFGESTEETDSAMDYIATATKWLVPVPVGNIKELYDYTTAIIKYFGGKGWNDDYQKMQNEIQKRVDKLKSEGVESVKARMEELKRLGQQGSDEYKLLEQALNELLNQQNQNNDENQNNEENNQPPVVEKYPHESEFTSYLGTLKKTPHPNTPYDSNADIYYDNESKEYIITNGTFTPY